MKQTELSDRAKEVIETGELDNYIRTRTSARRAQSVKYFPGEVVESIDPWKQKMGVFVTSIRWCNGLYGGYVLLNEAGNMFTTTNIQKVGEIRRVAL